MTVDIIIFALIAIYILIKLYNIIGSGGFGPDASSSQTAKEKVVINLKEVGYKVADEYKSENDESENKALAQLPKEIVSKIQDLKKRDKNFLLSNFLVNSEKAFELIIGAFANYDIKALNLLTAGSAQKNFADSLKEQEKLNHKVSIDIISFLGKEIIDISVKNNICQITVAFTTEQIFCILDENKKVVKGDGTKIEKIEDKWVFKRSLKVANPIWHVVETGS
ncbi:MAG: Tim44/TimA family putative adaptor protein [Rickettsiales bacterium]|jgi:predicted lipid-binding transport protein (Tim44 family)|nr:Tim44/TimA family putative adaptor protein [Rickettsiales bacterium]